MDRCRRPDKIPYPTRRVAKREAKRIHGRGRGTVNEYKCTCGFWHLGNADAMQRERTRNWPS